MIPSSRYFFDVPIYRCSPDQHESWIAQEKRKNLQPFEETRDSAPESLAISKQWFDEWHWYPWRYNETVGWVRLYALGAQIRADLWYVKAKRIVREARKRIFFVGKQFEISFCLADSDPEIEKAVLEELRGMKRQLRFRNRFIDLESFEFVARHLNWREILCFPERATPQIRRTLRDERAKSGLKGLELNSCIRNSSVWRTWIDTQSASPSRQRRHSTKGARLKLNSVSKNFALASQDPMLSGS